MTDENKILDDILEATAIPGLTAALAALSDLAGSSFSAIEASDRPGQKGEIRKIHTACRACIANCGVIATIQDGRVIKLQGDPADRMSKGSLCAKGLAGIQALYHPNRNKYPLQRVGERGENKWKRISWDEAIDIIARKLMETREQYGAEAVFCSTGGGGNPEIWSIARFCNIFGTPNWFEPGCAQCYLPRVLSTAMMYGGDDASIADSNALEIYFPEDTPMKSLVMWGTDPSYSCPASGGAAVVDLRAKGVKTVVIDPRLTPDAAKADVWLPIRPGSDVALMLAWIRYILDNRLYDHEFVLKWTNLPYLVNTKTQMLLRAEPGGLPGQPDTFMVYDARSQSVRPLPYPWDDNLEPVLDTSCMIDGIEFKTAYRLLRERVEPYTLQYAGEVCWLDAGRIEKAIRLFAENLPGGLALGVATDQTPNSVQAAMAANTIDLLLGNVERPGSLMQRFRKSGVFDMPNYPVPIAAGRLSDEQLKKRLGGIEHKGLHIWYAGHATSIFDAVLTGEPYKPRVWIDRSGNKMAAVADSQKVRRVIDELDFIVHMYMYPTSFSAYADILLPTAEWLETDMIVETCNTLVARQACTHLWETMDETDIWSRLARRCGELGHEACAKAFDVEYMGKDLSYWNSVVELWDHFLSRVNLSWNQLKEISPYEYMTKDAWKSYFIYQLIDPQTGLPNGFNTPSKKIELYLESMITLGRTGQPFSSCELPPASREYDPLPYYLEPSESPLDGSELAREYPLVMTGGRVPMFHHNTLRNVPWMRELYPVPELLVNPVDAEIYDVDQGDWVWIESLRGKIRAKASLTEAIKPGVVFMERFWFPETLNTKTHGWQEMNVNILTKADAPFNDVVGTYTLRSFLVKIFKADGPPEGIWQKPQDFRSWLPLENEAVEVTRP